MYDISLATMRGEMSMPDGTVRVELFVRSSVPSVARERQAAAIERLYALDDSIDAVGVRSWEKRIPIDAHGDRRETHHVYETLLDWACEHGVELRPFFETRECYSSITGESHTALVLPVMCLAVYEDDRLHGVYPHADADRTYAVGDALDALESDEGRPSAPPPVGAR